MRHFDYQLTLTLPGADAPRRGAGKALIHEQLDIAGTPQSWTRRYRIDPAARNDAPSGAARWTPEEEDTFCHSS